MSTETTTIYIDLETPADSITQEKERKCRKLFLISGIEYMAQRNFSPWHFLVYLPSKQLFGFYFVPSLPFRFINACSDIGFHLGHENGKACKMLLSIKMICDLKTLLLGRDVRGLM